jgi:hypothetical protein
MIDESPEVGHIFRHVPLAGRSFALAVASSVVSDDPEVATESRDDPVPVAVIYPGAVDEHEGITTLAGELPMESNSVDQYTRHADPVLLEENALLTSMLSTFLCGQRRLTLAFTCGSASEREPGRQVGVVGLPLVTQ